MQKVVTVVLTLAVLALSDIITNLPGANFPIKFNQYSGYINVNATNGRNLFYWFVESQNDPKNDPVVLWMNGGPGCSSLDGFLTEHGPFLVEPDGKTLAKNPYSWNNNANVIYVESPAGVGFSYSNTPQVDYTVVNDNKTAADMYQFLVSFFKKYPQFGNNPFFITGESYAGHYVPVCSNAVVQGNKAGKNPKINIQGFAVGNGIIDMSADQNSIPRYIYHHAMAAESAYQNAETQCKGDFYAHQDEPACSAALSTIWNGISGINLYNIYGRCENSAKMALNKGRHKGHPLLTMWDRATPSNDGVPCINSTDITTYLNSAAVKQALHVKPEIKWEICNFKINANYDWTFESMLPFYQNLLGAGLRGLVYTGDIDLAVNSMGSENALTKFANQQQSKVVSEWKSWHVEGQVAGFFKQWSNNLTFLTIRGAGHMVPTQKPQEAYTFFSKFLKNQPFGP